ncbi:MAG: hypothetical protein ACRDRK_08835 [Pseudonocardia sp.]
MSDDATPADADDTTPTTKNRRGKKGNPELLARMTALGASTAQPATSEPTPATRRRTKPVTAPSETATTADTGRSAPTRPAPADRPATRTPATRKQAPASRTPAMPAEQPKPVTYNARINLTTTPEQNRALDLARVEDGIDKTARLRAMIALWEKDERLRRRIDKEAKSWR